jgi:hypothetical protein
MKLGKVKICIEKKNFVYRLILPKKNNLLLLSFQPILQKQNIISRAPIKSFERYCNSNVSLRTLLTLLGIRGGGEGLLTPPPFFQRPKVSKIQGGKTLSGQNTCILNIVKSCNKMKHFIFH